MKKQIIDNTISYRHPVTSDGKYFFDLAIQSETLDVNSCYHYLIQCRHFSKTSMVAEYEGEIVGFVTGHIPPDEPLTLFVWQVTVAKKFRGRGLALGMLNALVTSLKDKRITEIKTTITKENRASIQLFKALSAIIRVPHHFNDVYFSEEQFGKSGHDAEILFRIGPALHVLGDDNENF
ncbi:MAG: diaminobutyrate acetyltransferase [Proteobacteria bacterium]|nr:diaminobutyrate acetyltransferase [Pseudomonadota bacterium]